MSALDTLRADVAGEVVVEGDETYARYRRIFARDALPAVVVRSRTAEDVRRALAYARAESLAVSVRGGGHGAGGFATNDGGLVIDLSPMDGVEVVGGDPAIVRIGGGATWGRVVDSLAPSGLAISSGDTRDVGVGGLLLGGGIGWMVRRYGLALDSLRSVEIVTADGAVRTASETENPDLFWAVRGGSGNLGVVTRFDVVARPIRDVVFGRLVYPVEEAGSVLEGWGAAMRTASEDLTTSVTVMPAMGEAPAAAIVGFCFASDDLGDAEKAIDPLRRLGTLRSTKLDVVPYGSILEDIGAPLPPGIGGMVRSGFVRSFDREFVGRLESGRQRLGTPIVNVRSLGGAFARVGADETAFAHRDSEVLVTTVVMGPRPALDAMAPGFGALWADLAPWVSGAYVNFMSTAEPDDVALIYPPETYRRLAKIKTAYDPGNLFDQNHNVVPG